jgi:hypothetical protein
LWIARTIAHFVGQVLANAPKDVVQALHDEHVERAPAVVDSVVVLHR